MIAAEFHAHKRSLILRGEVATLSEGGSSDIESYRRYLLAALGDFAVMIEMVLRTQRGYVDHFDIRKDQRVTVAADNPRAEITGHYPSGDIFEITVGIGLFLGLEDLLYRLVVDTDFLSFEHYNSSSPIGRRRGGECDHLTFYACSSSKPAKRFFDYSAVAHPEGTTSTNSWLYAILSHYPIEDERRESANMLFNSALHWLVAHENSHYFNFHLELLHDQYFAEELNRHSFTDLSIMVEWQADREASLLLLKTAFNEEYASFAPSGLKENTSIWLARFLSISVAVPLMMFYNELANRNEHSEGQRRPHLSIHTRIAILIQTWAEFFSGNNFEALRNIHPDIELNYFLYNFIRGFIRDLAVISDVLCCEGNPNNEPLTTPIIGFSPFQRLKTLSVVDDEGDEEILTMMFLQNFFGEFCEGHAIADADQIRLAHFERLWIADYKELILPQTKEMISITSSLVRSDSILMENLKSIAKIRHDDPFFSAMKEQRRVEILSEFQDLRDAFDEL